MGPLWNMTDLPDNEATCRRCDWECFRDPSELFGPMTTAISSPREMLRKFKARPDFFRLWVEDLRYYLICDTFDGTKPMLPDKMARFGLPASSSTLRHPLGKELAPTCR